MRLSPIQTVGYAVLSVLWLAGPASGNPYSEGALGQEAVSQQQAVDDPFLWTVETPTRVENRAGRVRLILKVPAGHVVYRDQVAVDVIQSAGVVFGGPVYPKAVRLADPANKGTQRDVYERDIAIDVPFTVGSLGGSLAEVEFSVAHQGCKVGLCYARQSRTLKTLIRIPGDDATRSPR